MNKHKISNVILRCFILFGGMSILSQTMAMQQDPEVRMNTVISQHNARLAQRDNINRDLTFENEFFQAHQIFGQNCGGQSLVCQDTQQPGQCFVQQHVVAQNRLLVSQQEIQQEIQRHQPLFQTMVQYRNTLQTLRKKIANENEFFQAHQIFGQNCGGQSLVCQDTQQPGQCFVQQHTARHQNLSNKLQTTRNLIP